MQKLGLKQSQKTKLSPKQVQFVQMLQIPAEAILERIQEEIANNPTLEAEKKEESAPQEEEIREEYPTLSGGKGGKRHTPTLISEELLKTKLGTRQLSWHEKLLEQVALLPFNKEEMTIARYLIGSLAADGYLRTSLEVTVHNLAFSHYIHTTKKEVEKILQHIQALDPPGIAARNLQECLLLQLDRKKKNQTVELAQKILTHTFDAFSKKNYRKMALLLKIDDEASLKKAIEFITHLSPKPIIQSEEIARPRKRPDFIVQKDENEELTVALYHDYTPTLRIRKQYKEMLNKYDRKKGTKASEVKQFVKNNIQRAQWFIESIEKRRETLLRTMQAIVKLQKPFFQTQDEQKLRPLFMRHIADEIDMDLSTVSRVVSGKSVLTDFGTYPLKYFFSEAINTTQGEQVSSRTIKSLLQTLIEQENKQQPYTDEELVTHMQKKGYIVARRTIAKYRSQLGLPVARMRKQL